MGLQVEDHRRTELEQNYCLLASCCTGEAVIQGDRAIACVGGGAGSIRAISIGHAEAVAIRAEVDRLGGVPGIISHPSAPSPGFPLLPIEGANIDEVNTQVEAQIIGVLTEGNLTSVEGDNYRGGVASEALMALAERDVPVEDESNMFGIISRPFRQRLIDRTEFSNGHYVDVKGRMGVPRRMWRWSGINWAVASFKGGGFVFHRHAIAHAVNTKDAEFDARRISLRAGTHLLQPNGAIKLG